MLAEARRLYSSECKPDQSEPLGAMGDENAEGEEEEGNEDDLCEEMEEEEEG